MNLQELQNLLDEQNKQIKAGQNGNGDFVITNNLIIEKSFSKLLPDNIVKVTGNIYIRENATIPENFLPQLKKKE